MSEHPAGTDLSLVVEGERYKVGEDGKYVLNKAGTAYKKRTGWKPGTDQGRSLEDLKRDNVPDFSYRMKFDGYDKDGYEKFVTLNRRTSQGFPTCEQVEKMILNYLDNTEFDRLTITGLQMALGGRSRADAMGTRKAYKDLIDRAKLIIEHKYELDLQKGTPTGAIFALKQQGWKDRHETEMMHSFKQVESVKLGDGEVLDLGVGEVKRIEGGQ